MNLLIALVGPTGIGKSKLAIELAQLFDGEIINADSRQVYRFMDIGTGKPTKEEQKLVPHHLFDIINPDEYFSIATYQKLTNDIIISIQKRQKLPLLVGGSGLYIWSILEKWSIPRVTPDLKLRKLLEEKAKNEGTYSLYNDLMKVDPASARNIDSKNMRRIIRALEIYYISNKKASEQYNKMNIESNTLIIGLTMERKRLYDVIDLRIDNMIKIGLIDEVKNLLLKGYSLELPSMSSIGYKEIGLYLQNKLSLNDAIQKIKFNTHKFVRHQYSWFRLKDSRIHWFDINNNTKDNIIILIKEFIIREQLKNGIHQNAGYGK